MAASTPTSKLQLSVDDIRNLAVRHVKSALGKHYPELSRMNDQLKKDIGLPLISEDALIEQAYNKMWSDATEHGLMKPGCERPADGAAALEQLSKWNPAVTKVVPKPETEERSVLAEASSASDSAEEDLTVIHPPRPSSAIETTPERDNEITRTLSAVPGAIDVGETIVESTVTKEDGGSSERV